MKGNAGNYDLNGFNEFGIPERDAAPDAEAVGAMRLQDPGYAMLDGIDMSAVRHMPQRAGNVDVWGTKCDSHISYTDEKGGSKQMRGAGMRVAEIDGNAYLIDPMGKVYDREIGNDRVRDAAEIGDTLSVKGIDLTMKWDKGSRMETVLPEIRAYAKAAGVSIDDARGVYNDLAKADYISKEEDRMEELSGKIGSLIGESKDLILTYREDAEKLSAARDSIEQETDGGDHSMKLAEIGRILEENKELISAYEDKIDKLSSLREDVLAAKESGGEADERIGRFISVEKSLDRDVFQEISERDGYADRVERALDPDTPPLEPAVRDVEKEPEPTGWEESDQVDREEPDVVDRKEEPDSTESAESAADEKPADDAEKKEEPSQAAAVDRAEDKEGEEKAEGFSGLLRGMELSPEERGRAEELGFSEKGYAEALEIIGGAMESVFGKEKATEIIRDTIQDTEVDPDTDFKDALLENIEIAVEDDKDLKLAFEQAMGKDQKDSPVEKPQEQDGDPPAPKGKEDKERDYYLEKLESAQQDYEGSKNYLFRNTFTRIDQLRVDYYAYKSDSPVAGDRVPTGVDVFFDVVKIINSNIFETAIEMVIRGIFERVEPPEEKQADVERTEKAEEQPEFRDDLTFNAEAIDDNRLDPVGMPERGIKPDMEKIQAARESDPLYARPFGVDIAVAQPVQSRFSNIEVWRMEVPYESRGAISYGDGKTLYPTPMRIARMDGNLFLVEPSGRVAAREIGNAAVKDAPEVGDRIAQLDTGKGKTGKYLEECAEAKGLTKEELAGQLDSHAKDVYIAEVKESLAAAADQYDTLRGADTEKLSELRQDLFYLDAERAGCGERLESLPEDSPERGALSDKLEQLSELLGEILEKTGRLEHRREVMGGAAVDTRQLEAHATPRNMEAAASYFNHVDRDALAPFAGREEYREKYETLVDRDGVEKRVEAYNERHPDNRLSVDRDSGEIYNRFGVSESGGFQADRVDAGVRDRFDMSDTEDWVAENRREGFAEFRAEEVSPRVDRDDFSSALEKAAGVEGRENFLSKIEGKSPEEIKGGLIETLRDAVIRETPSLQGAADAIIEKGADPRARVELRDFERDADALKNGYAVDKDIYVKDDSTREIIVEKLSEVPSRLELLRDAVNLPEDRLAFLDTREAPNDVDRDHQDVEKPEKDAEKPQEELEKHPQDAEKTPEDIEKHPEDRADRNIPEMENKDKDGVEPDGKEPGQVEREEPERDGRVDAAEEGRLEQNPAALDDIESRMEKEAPDNEKMEFPVEAEDIDVPPEPEIPGLVTVEEDPAGREGMEKDAAPEEDDDPYADLFADADPPGYGLPEETGEDSDIVEEDVPLEGAEAGSSAEELYDKVTAESGEEKEKFIEERFQAYLEGDDMELSDLFTDDLLGILADSGDNIDFMYDSLAATIENGFDGHESKIGELAYELVSLDDAGICQGIDHLQGFLTEHDIPDELAVSLFEMVADNTELVSDLVHVDARADLHIGTVEIEDTGVFIVDSVAVYDRDGNELTEGVDPLDFMMSALQDIVGNLFGPESADLAQQIMDNYDPDPDMILPLQVEDLLSRIDTVAQDAIRETIDNIERQLPEDIGRPDMETVPADVETPAMEETGQVLQDLSVLDATEMTPEEAYREDPAFADVDTGADGDFGDDVSLIPGEGDFIPDTGDGLEDAVGAEEAVDAFLG